MAEAFEAAVRLAGNLPTEVEHAGRDVLGGLAPRGDLQIFVDHQLGDGEAIVDLHLDVRAVPLGVHQFLAGRP